MAVQNFKILHINDDKITEAGVLIKIIMIIITTTIHSQASSFNPLFSRSIHISSSLRVVINSALTKTVGIAQSVRRLVTG